MPQLEQSDKITAVAQAVLIREVLDQVRQAFGLGVDALLAKLLQQFPDSPKAPDAMFNIANSQIQLADIEGAKKTLRSLLGQFPNSEVAPSAKKRLAVLDAIKSR